MKTRILSIGTTALVAFGLAFPAVAADFSPETKFTLKPRKVKANPEVTVKVAQDEGEEELAHVELTVPAGFGLPGDGAIDDGEVLGEGEIVIDAGPRCGGFPAGSVPFTVPVEIIERDRTQDEIAAGVKAVWVVDLRPVTTIDLLITGSRRKGWTLAGDIPQNGATCPPFSFEATINQKSSDTGRKIYKNPKKPGRYTFEAHYEGVDGSSSHIEQKVRIKR